MLPQEAHANNNWYLFLFPEFSCCTIFNTLSDVQTLSLNDLPPEDEDDDPFTAKLMSFEVRDYIPL